MYNSTRYLNRSTGQKASGNSCAYVYFTHGLAAQGKTYWSSSPSLTGTYTVHVSRGDYLSLALGYVRGPALSPRVEDALVFTANWSLYF